MKAIVVGSGFGGLAVGLRLLAKGYEVTIVEAREKVGGRAYQLKSHGYTFDMGPSLVTAPALFDELFGLFGKDKKDYFELLPLDPYYRIYFEEESGGGFKKIDYSGSPEKMRDEMEKLEVGGARKYDRYFEMTRPIFEASYNRYGGKAFLKLSEFLKIIPEMVRLNALIPMTSFVGRVFKSEYSIRTFSFHPLYIGTNPSQAPAALGFIPWLEREQGVWYAKGGMYSIVTALAKLFIENGGKIVCNAKVNAYELNDKDRRMIEKIVLDGGQSLRADVFISNADVANTYSMLTPTIPQISRKVTSTRKKSYSMSLFMLYFGLKRQYHDKLAHHTLVLGRDYNQLLNEIFNFKVEPKSLSMYIHIPTYSEQEMAPAGCESMYVLIPVPHLNKNFSWNKAYEKKLRDWVVDYMEHTFGLTDFQDNIDYESSMTPVNFEKDLNSTYGAAFATQLKMSQSVYFRQHNKASEIDNLYFVGGGTHPGPGVPGVLLTAKATADLLPVVT